MSSLKRLGFLFTLASAVFFSLLPFIWFLFTSLKSELELTAIPPTILPGKINLDFYSSAIINYNLFSYIKNSVIVAGLTTIICVSIGCLAAYALSRLKLRYKGIILMVILAVAMFPQISIAGPVWRILRGLGWLNTYQGLILPYVALSLPLSIWIMTSFFKELPYELEEAARIDGCTPLQALYKVIFPLAAPGVFTAAILTFIHAWNEFFFALLILTRPDMQTLPVGIALFQGEFTLPWGEIAAASVVATLPLVFLVLFFQKRIVSGLTAGAIKG
jgi:multiple sugar transport system permease protein